LRADRPYPRLRRLVQLEEVVGSGKRIDIWRLAEHDWQMAELCDCWQ
jgi:hypothetical protein